MGTQRVALEGTGGGFGSLIQGMATTSPEGAIRVLLTNVTYQQIHAGGDGRLERYVNLTVSGLMAGQRFNMHHYRIDNTHSNVYAAWQALGRPDWPDAAQLAELHRLDALETVEPGREVVADPGGRITLDFNLPMPAVSMVELVPITAAIDRGLSRAAEGPGRAVLKP